MPVDSRHFEYDGAVSQWQTMRDCVAGQDAVKAAGKKYLPSLEGQSDTAYTGKYLLRANFFNATGRTLEGLVGMIFRKDPIIKVPAGLEELLNDLDANGTPVVPFMKQITSEVMEVNRCGVLVDFPEAATQTLTQAQAQAAGRRPYCAMYKAEDIINWRTERRNGRTMLTMVVLSEIRQTPSEKDSFVMAESVQYRELRINEQGFYEQRVWVKDNSRSKYRIDATITPRKKGRQFNYIPFWFFSVMGNTPSIQVPMLKDLADVNIGHYRNSADLENGLHFAGTPTPVLIGYRKEEDEVIQLGAETVLCIGDPSGDAKYLEFQGKGLEPIKEEMRSKEDRMAALGARMLSTEKETPESGYALSIRNTGEYSATASVSNSVSYVFDMVLRELAEWAGYSTAEVSVALNTDFVARNIDANTLSAWLKVLQAGKISHKDFIRILQEGEAVPTERTSEDILADVENEEPALGELGLGNNVDFKV